MKNHWLYTAALVVLLQSLPSHAEAAPAARRRFALLVGANDGGPGRMLRHAVSDAHAFGKVMQGLGGVRSQDLRLLENPRPESVREALNELGNALATSKRIGKAAELVFYYSGHSDERGLLLAGERVPFDELRQLLQRIPADFRVAVLDSCASGSFTRSKGGTPVPPFLLDTGTHVSGDAVLTSSSATEASQESDRLASSFFTHHLLSGLRGAADVSHDGKVTLNEAYQFAFHETLARTERTRAGAQHPGYEMAVSGTGDLVITDLRGSGATLHIPGPVGGHLFIRNTTGRLVVELRKTPGTPIDLGLEAGRYQLTLVREEVLGMALDLKEGSTATLDVAALDLLPMEANPLRGEAAEIAAEPRPPDLPRQWNGEIRLGAFRSTVSSFPDDDTNAVGFPVIGLTYFLRPLKDDGRTPYQLLRFVQRPHMIALEVAGFTGPDPRFFPFLAWEPAISASINVFPWSWLGLTAHGGVNRSSAYSGGVLYGSSFGGKATVYPTSNLRVSASYKGAREQLGSLDLEPVSPLWSTSYFTPTGLDLFSLRSEWRVAERWLLSVSASGGWQYPRAEELYTREWEVTGQVPQLGLALDGTFFANRKLSIGMTLSGSGAGRQYWNESDRLFRPAPASYQIAAVPHVHWYMADWISMAANLGPVFEFNDQGFGTSVVAGLSFSVRL